MPAVAARRTAGIAAMIGPMIGSSSRMPAITESRTAYRPKIGSTVRLRIIRPMNVKIADREAEDQLAADPLAEDALDASAAAPSVSNRHAGRQRPVERLRPARRGP